MDNDFADQLRKLRLSAKRDGELGRDSGRTDEIERDALKMLAATLAREEAHFLNGDHKKGDPKPRGIARGGL